MKYLIVCLLAVACFGGESKCKSYTLKVDSITESKRGSGLVAFRGSMLEDPWVYIQITGAKDLGYKVGDTLEVNIK